MKAVVHIGMPKAGSTVLQRTLTKSRAVLADAGLHYLVPKDESAYNHKYLGALIAPYETGPRDFRRLSKQEHEARVREFCDMLTARAAKVSRGKFLLSSEYLWRMQTCKSANLLQQQFERMSITSLEFLAYIRRPSDFYLSASQQRLRASAIFEPQEIRDSHAILNSYRSSFDKASFQVRVFDRQNMIEGDIVADFASVYAPGAAAALKQVVIGADNSSLSAEAMVILQTFRREFYGDQNEVFNKPTKELIDRLRLLDTADKPPSPVLRTEWRDYADYRDDVPLRLRDDWGISFAQFDYNRLERANYAAEPLDGKDVRHVVRVDDERLASMVSRLQTSGGNVTQNPQVKQDGPYLLHKMLRHMPFPWTR